MSFSYSTLFTRLGKIAGRLNDVNNFIGTGTIGPTVDTLQGEYASPDLNLVGGLYSARDSYRQAHTSWQNYLSALAQATVIQMVNEYAPLKKQDLPTALAWLINQMKNVDSQSVAKPTVSSTATASGANIGTGVLVVGNLGANGIQQDYEMAETITFTVTKDGQSGGTAGQETFTITSPVAEGNLLQWDYPLGSGLSITDNAIDGTVNNTGGQLLYNGSWGAWSSPSTGPDSWLVLSGAVGTDIQESSGSGAYKGNNGLIFAGTNTPSLSQPFNTTATTAGNSGGSPSKLTPLTQYIGNFWIKYSGTAPTAGDITIDLTDGTNTTLNDAAGTPNSLVIPYNSASLTTGWLPISFVFRTGPVVPATGYRLRVRVSTAFSSGVTLYLGNLAFTPANLTYAGGPVFAVFSGATNFIQGDTFTAAVSNNRLTAAKWQTSADQLFNLKGLALQLPSSGSPTILDSLIS